MHGSMHQLSLTVYCFETILVCPCLFTNITSKIELPNLECGLFMGAAYLPARTYKCYCSVQSVLVPVQLTNVSSDQTVREGSNMMLVCEATGRPDPKITWTRVVEDGSNSEVLHNATTWNFANINRTISGTYCCTADSGYGNLASHEVKVNVKCKYIIIINYNPTPFLDRV